ncbi:MAG: pyridoxamine 5'-phosphate oxidase family protein [Hyphomicrobiaceae bacterium]
MNDVANISGSPFHEGEQAVQERLGARDIEAWARKVVRDYLPEQHVAFHTSLPFLVAAARDEKERPWVTLLAGPDGFVSAPDSRHLVIGARPPRGDALEGAFHPGADVGILGIELATRRRNRVNGRITGDDKDGLTFRVDQSFGNCPQYIREREWRRVDVAPSGKSSRGRALTPSQRTWIGKADTFFIASGYRGEGENRVHGMDASHRGGERGFIQVLDGKRLRFPDYAGNNHFNTIGNIVLDPRVGLLFIDFETGSLLQLTGTASIDWDSEEVAAIPGARRLVSINIAEVIELPSAINLRWEVDADSVRSLRMAEKTRESADVTSFVFEARDSGALAAFEPGQHLPIELRIPGQKEPARRTYSLSSAPHDARYRITVKREPNGLASNYLHDKLEVGAVIESRRPAGDFMMTCNICPLVLVSAGVGVTPMMSILHAVAAEGGERPVWFVHGARDALHHPLADEVRDIAASHGNINTHIAYSRPRPEDVVGKHYNSEGRIDGSLLARLVQNPNAHYFLCGPTQFMSDIQDALEHQNVPSDQIHTETFGPAG